MRQVHLKNVAWPEVDRPMVRPEIPNGSFSRHASALREAMAENDLDCVAVYGDREHYANFKYFLGFEPRFEEGLAVIYRDPSAGDAVLLGNECVGMAEYARIPVRAVLCQFFSLPGQPMDRFVRMEDCLREAGLREGMRVGLVDWKLMTSRHGENPTRLFCAPHFLTEALRHVVGEENMMNATGLLIDPDRGIRRIHDVHEIAYMEYGAALASDGILHVWRDMEPGMREMELADRLCAYGQQLSCHTMFSSGENTKKGLISPAFRPLEVGDPVSFSMGLEGGLSCRGGYAVHGIEEMPAAHRIFEEEIAKPYYGAVVDWYETIGIGVSGGELYDVVQTDIPHEKFGWVLNPGHLISFEEWLTSGIAPGNRGIFCSGMLVQMDIIPSVAPCVSPNVEDGICLADEKLRAQIAVCYPEMWRRMQQRRAYMRDTLGIQLKPEVLPLSNLAGRYSPYLLDRSRAFTVL